MEYVQMNMDEWLCIKAQLKEELNGVAEGFVKIGYYLRKIDDGQLFRNDGYTSLAAFAKAEYGLSPSTTSRFMEINRKYSLNGNSELLRPEFAGLGSTKLAEMLGLPDGDLELIRPETKREDIRELKHFNREHPGCEDTGLKEVVRKFYEAYPDLENDLRESLVLQIGDVKGAVDILNPGGNRVFRSGVYFVMMYEDKLKIKKFGEGNSELTWETFLEISQEIFVERAEAEIAEMPEEDPKEMEMDQENDASAEPEVPRQESEEPDRKPVAPAQKMEDVDQRAGSREVSQVKPQKADRALKKEPAKERQQEEKREADQEILDNPVKVLEARLREEAAVVIELAEAAEYLKAMEGCKSLAKTLEELALVASGEQEEV